MNNFKKHIFNTFDLDLWDYLKTTKKPILIYGMGNGADKIIAVLESYGIEFADIFASDGFVRGHSFHGKIVLSYSQACEKYEDFIILLSFGTRLSEVMNWIYELNKKHELYAPDVPVCPGELFCTAFFDAHENDLFSSRELLADEKSRQIFDDIIRFKLSGRLEYLISTECDENSVDSLLSLDSYTTYLDLGAYNGDTVRKYLDLCPNLTKIYAFEPDIRNFKKLSAYASAEQRAEILPLNYASWNENTTLEFSSSGNRNSSGSGTASHQSKIVLIEAKRPDSIVSSIDFIKFDVEGAEYKAILGCKELIKASSPDMLISMYHKSEDMYELIPLISSLAPNSKLFLRRLPYIPAWDLNLYVTK